MQRDMESILRGDLKNVYGQWLVRCLSVLKNPNNVFRLALYGLDEI